MILSPVLLDRPFYQSEGKAVNLGSKSARARYLPLGCGLFGKISHFVRDDKSLNLGARNLFRWVSLMAGSKPLPKTAVALPKKLIVIGCDRLKTIESKVPWQKRN
jgi:hypothetical protein